MNPTHVLAAATAFTLLFASAASAADAKARAQAHYKEGQTKYEAGQYAEALAAFELAFQAVPAPALHFNIAQCHRKLGQHEPAVIALEKFLAEQKEIPAKIRRDAETQLEEERALLEAERQQQAAAAAAAPPPPTTAPAEPEPQPQPTAEDDVPLWKNPLVIGAAAGTALVAAAAGAWAIYSLRPGPTPPSTSLGTVDLR